MNNYHYQIDFLESQDVFIALVYANSDLIATSNPLDTKSQAMSWASGCITGVRLARGEL